MGKLYLERYKVTVYIDQSTAKQKAIQINT